MHNSTKQQGVGLLEVLIALLVLSIGIMGLAALQSTGLRLNTQSYQRTQAIMAIQDIVDRIRANPSGQSAGEYDTVTYASTLPSAPDCADGTTICSSGDMAKYDIRQWKLALQDLLGPTADGQIQVTAGVPAIHVVSVQWMENDLTLSFTQEVQIR